jgi:hypothetical protein
MKVLWNAYESAMKRLWKTYGCNQKRLWNAPRSLVRRTAHTVHRADPWANAYETPMNVLWNAYEWWAMKGLWKLTSQVVVEDTYRVEHLLIPHQNTSHLTRNSFRKLLGNISKKVKKCPPRWSSPTPTWWSIWLPWGETFTLLTSNLIAHYKANRPRWTRWIL